MDENLPPNIANDVQPKPEPVFVKKVVEMPIMDSDLRKKIGGAGPQSAGGFKGFYNANKIYFWAILAGIIIISVLSFFAFRRSAPSAPKQANVAINVQVPDTVPSGGQVVYTITIQNNDTQKLVGMQLEVAYPDGLSFVSSAPDAFRAQNLSGTLFPVPDLIPGQNTVLFLKTNVSGNVNDQKTLDLKLHYKYSNFNSEFVKDQPVTVRLVASDVTVELNGPTTTNNAQLVTYSVKYQNNSDSDIQNARVKMDYPDGFSFASATPPPDLGSDTWNVGTLAKGGSGDIEIQGTFNSANPGESRTAMAEFLVLGQDGQYFTQNSSSFTTGISSLPLVVTQALQSNNNNNVISPGDNLTFNVTYQNNASTAANGVNIEVDLNSKVVDLSSLRAQGAQINNSTIIWNASGVQQLATLLPNQSGQLSFSLKINNPATKDSSTNLTVVSNIQIKSNEYSTAFPGPQLSLKVSSPSAITSALSFVSGQLPPQVGLSTVYKVHLALSNSSNDYSSGLLTAFVPLGAGGVLTNSYTPAEAANVQYDPTTGKLTWNVGSLRANTGRFSQPRVLEFNVKLSPSASQVGQSPVLVNKINFTAKDIFTSQDVNITAPDIKTSDLPQGNGGFGSGQVVQ